MAKIIISSNSLDLAKEELQENFKIFWFKQMTEESLLLELEGNFEDVVKKQFFFVRDAFPVDFCLELNLKEEDKDILVNNYHHFNLHKNDILAIHLHFNSKIPYAKMDFLRGLFDVLEQNKIEVNQKAPQKILNLYEYNGKLYGSTIKVGQAISTWALGQFRFRKDDNCISRAEFKLLEAIELFKLDMQNYKTAIDLGAAPGGWSRVLLGQGLEVAAVDPADMDKSLISNPKLQHYAMTSQKYFSQHRDKRYDIIVNDMKMDFRDSAKLMANASQYLNDKGLALMTLKLRPDGKELENIKVSLEILEKHYKIVAARQLFHNRSEITIIMGKLA